ncbi:MAG: hypothetical protein KDK28_16885 [Maritimibacter sp.]|nr:hypothetical protein [Maritimibacter sp.]
MEDVSGLYLHLGAHRTGTGSFQEFLLLNSGRLRDHGVNLAVANRDGVLRSSLKIRLPDARHFRSGKLADHRRWREEQIDETALNREPLSLISEENLPGTINKIISPAIYPIARQRLGFLKSGLKRPVRRVLFVTRSYDTFFPSAFRKRMELRALDPFEHYRDEIMTMRRGWNDVIRDIKDGLEAEEVHVLPFEDRRSYADLLRVLLPFLPADGWILPDGDRNVSATDAACHAIQRAYHNGEKLSKDRIAEIAAQFADDPSGPPAAAFSAADAAALVARYAADLDAVRALPFVEFHSA